MVELTKNAPNNKKDNLDSADEKVIASARNARKIVHPESVPEKLSDPANRGVSRKVKRLAYTKYAKLKKKVFEFEQTNLEFIVLFPAADFGLTDKDFWVMGGNSAMFYVMELAALIGKKTAHVRADLDNTDTRFPGGVSYITKIDEFLQAATDVGYKRRPDMDEAGDGEIYLQLPRAHTKDDVSMLFKLLRDRIENIYAMIHPDVSYPDIHKKIIVLTKTVPSKAARMNHMYRDTIGEELTNRTFEILRIHSDIMHEHGDIVANAKELVRVTDILLEEVGLCLEMSLLDIATCARIANAGVELKNLLKGKIINKLEKK